ncbi:flagellar hook-associated protein FlgK [Burkholderia ubonensis]|uniref:flagellar hook-associated protein FlgK n=1 Tax=Burkholderia ubonensis TaxID=101571 RepID=UPI00075D8376|nr:flagellar hook-associated protein FlgK [Burkholderia ubonensis]KWB79426.1 hypothetical protein WL42_12760 [Burkholderia ubonensis]
MSIITNALSGILAAQYGQNATSINIANLMTPGFSRRGVFFSTSPSGGVDTSAMFRYNDIYKDHQLWKSNSDLGEHDTAQTYYDQIETAFGSDTSGVMDNMGMRELFDALNRASQHPTDSALRSGVLSAADSMAKKFNSALKTMHDQLDALEQQRTSSADGVNTLTKQIADLNKQIAAARSSGQDLNALEDARDQAIDQLSKLANVQVLDQGNGTVDVSLAASGQPLVIGDTAATMSVTRDAQQVQHLTVQFGTQTFQVPDDKVGGSLGGLYQFETQTLRPQMQNLVNVAQQFAQAFNGQLAAGYDMNGNRGKPLFVFNSGTGTLDIDHSLKWDELAFSADGTQANTGNLQELLKVKNRNVTLAGIGTVTFGGVEAAIVGKIGAQSKQNKEACDTAKKVRDQAEAAWQSESGVNSQEEGVSMEEYLQMSQANMKCIAIADQLFQTVLQSI